MILPGATTSSSTVDIPTGERVPDLGQYAFMTSDPARVSTTYRITRERADRLLFLFHGWSAEQHHLAAYVPLIDPDERFSAISPRGLHDLPEGDGASWYDRTPEGPDPASFRAAVDALVALTEAEMEAAGIGPENTVGLGGGWRVGGHGNFLGWAGSLVAFLGRRSSLCLQ